MKKKTLLVSVLLLEMLISIFAQNSENRRFYFEAGLGFASVTYSNELDAAFKSLEKLGFDRMTMYLDLSLGYAVLQNLYLIGSISGIGDRYSYEKEFVQLNSYLYGLGIRFYPFTTGIQLGLDVGLAKSLLNSSIPGANNVVSENGFGGKLVFAYDFDSTLTGPAALVGIAIMGGTIENESLGSASLFVNFIYK